MNRPDFLEAAMAGASGMTFGGLPLRREAGSTREKPKKPNILLIMADDMGFSDVGCYGGEIHTPNINSLADEGMRFTQFYNAARCCPTRASLLTGLYPHQAGMGDMVHSHPDPSKPEAYQGYLNHRCVTLAEVLEQAGYQTLMSGKWHVGEHQTPLAHEPWL